MSVRIENIEEDGLRGALLRRKGDIERDGTLLTLFVLGCRSLISSIFGMRCISPRNR